MQNHYLTDHITSLESLNNAFGAIFQNTLFDCTSSGNDFSAIGEGIITQEFFLGNQTVHNLETINAINFNHYVITIPKEGQFTSNADSKTILNTSGKTGAIVFPTDKLLYQKSTNYISDNIIAMNFNVLKDKLERKFGIFKAEDQIFQLDHNNPKVKTLYNYIESTLDMVRSYPDIRESLFLKMNIKEIAVLMVVDLIGELLKQDSLQNDKPERILVSLAEDVIDEYCAEIRTINEIADKLNTSERNLQKAFKKYRNYSPMQFLKERKLHKAHKLILSNRNSSTTIKEIALSVGIFDLNRFGKYYAELFNELPSSTLKK